MLESGLLRETGDAWELERPLPPLAVPSTLQDSLMARLDRLDHIRSVAQLAATLGREFRYDALKAVSDLDDATLGAGLARLVEAELVYQRGLPPRAAYHVPARPHAGSGVHLAPPEHTASNGTSTSPEVLEREFGKIRDTQPEMLAHHYTQAGLAAEAISWWQRAAQAATQRWANVEAVAHLEKAMELLPALPGERERSQRELPIQLGLANAWSVLKGWVPGVNYICARRCNCR